MDESLSRRFRRFGEVECRVDSPPYARLAVAVAEDPEILALLAPVERRQPNLFFAAARFLGAPCDSPSAFRVFALEHASELIDVMRSRRTQTNEVGRCATLLCALAGLPPPLALLEVGASAGLCLLADRYQYEYAAPDLRRVLGEGPPRIGCDVRGAVPIPERLPEIVWRRGLDMSPVDLADAAAVRWLEACVWPGRPERLRRLQEAIAVARRDPPRVLPGDAVQDLPALAAEAPRDATLVIFHSALLAYLDRDRRARFTSTVKGLGAVWLAQEAPGLVAESPQPLPGEACFLLTRGESPLAAIHPHGRWIEPIA